MKAVTIAQPWAFLLVAGAKKYETRSWRTSHRGPLLVHAAGRLPRAQGEVCAREPVLSLLKGLGVSGAEQLPLGAIIGSVDVIDCVDVDALLGELSEQERALGEFGPGRWAWRLGNRRMFAAPIVCRGHRGLFEVHAAG